MKKGSLIEVARLLMVALTVCAASVELSAQNNPQEGTLDTLIGIDNVVVTATKVSVNRNTVASSVSVVSRDKIENSSESALLPVLSHRIPGLFVTERGMTGFGGSSGGAGAVNIRGVGQTNKVLMMFDGQPQWAGLFGHSIPDSYVASDADRVEVVRGPGSLLYGSNAMGGMVNIITRQPHEDGFHGDARIMYGSYNTQKYMIGAGQKSGKWSTYVSLNHDYTDGHRDYSEFKITNGFVNVGYQASDAIKLNGRVTLGKFLSENPGETFEPLFDNITDMSRGTASFSVENKFDKVSGALQLFYNWGVHEINDGYGVGESPRDYLFNSTDHNYGVMFYQNFSFFEGNSLTAGIDYKNWGGHAWNAYFDGEEKDIIDTDVTEAAGYVIMQQSLWDKITLNGGVRYEYNETYGGEWVPQAGVAYNPQPGTALKFTVGKGFRSPNLRELYMYVPANPDLKPENMISYEASVEQVLGRGLVVGLTAFYIDGDNMIQMEVVDGRKKNMNTGAFTNKGVEVEAEWAVSRALNLAANYSYLHTDKPLLAAPEHKVFAEAVYKFGRFTFMADMQYIGGLYVNTTAPKKESYTLFDAKLSYMIGSRSKGLNLFVKGENLTDREYCINDGFPMPGVTVMGGMNFYF